MPRLAIFLRDLAGGGAERVMMTLAEGFADRNVTVDLLLVEKSGPYLDELSNRINIIDLGRRRLLTSFPDLIKYLVTSKPDALLSALEDSNLIAILSCLFSRIPVRLVVTVHNHISIESLRSPSIKRKVAPFLIRCLYRFADRVIAVSEGVKKDIIDIGVPGTLVSTIYNPILTSDLRSQLQQRAPHPWLCTEDTPVLIGVGRLHPQKNFPLLIRAFHEARKSRPMKLIILGEGPERIKLEQLIEQLDIREHVLLPGFVRNPVAWIHYASIMILTSSWEGFGNVLVEAMAAGTQIISTRCKSGPEEVLGNGKYGRLVPVGDLMSLVKAIDDTFINPTSTDALLERAEDFEVKCILDQYYNACLL